MAGPAGDGGASQRPDPLRRRLREWARAGDLLQRAHAVPVALLRGGRPDDLMIPDSCGVRAKRGGDLTGPNPTDRGKRGTKRHVAVTGDGAPVARAATAANVNDTPPSGRLFLPAVAVVARPRTVFAETRGTTPSPVAIRAARSGPSPVAIRAARSGPSPAATGAAGRTARGWAAAAPAGRAQPGLALLEDRRLALRYDRLGSVIQSPLRAARLFLAAGRLARELWQPLLNKAPADTTRAPVALAARPPRT